MDNITDNGEWHLWNDAEFERNINIRRIHMNANGTLMDVLKWQVVSENAEYRMTYCEMGRRASGRG